MQKSHTMRLFASSVVLYAQVLRRAVRPRRERSLRHNISRGCAVFSCAYCVDPCHGMRDHRYVVHIWQLAPSDALMVAHIPMSKDSSEGDFFRHQWSNLIRRRGLVTMANVPHSGSRYTDMYKIPQLKSEYQRVAEKYYWLGLRSLMIRREC